MQSLLLRFENLFSREGLFASRQRNISVFYLLKCINLMLSGWKTLIVKYLMTLSIFACNFPELCPSQTSFSVPCELKIEREFNSAILWSAVNSAVCRWSFDLQMYFLNLSSIMQILSRLLKLLTALWSFRKKVVVRPKKISLIFGNRPGEFFLSFTRPHSRMCIRIYIFNCKRKTKKNNQKYKKQKKLKKKREYL